MALLDHSLERSTTCERHHASFAAIGDAADQLQKIAPHIESYELEFFCRAGS